MQKKSYMTTEKGVLLKGYSYSNEEIDAAAKTGQLLCLRLETHYRCNLDCIYCYSYLRQQDNDGAEMSFEDACSIIDQGRALGLRSIVYLGGGEPFLYTYFWELMEYIDSSGIIPVIFTNGMTVTPEAAARLYQLNAAIMIKLDGDEETQNWLTGPASFAKIRTGIKILMGAGFNKLDGRFTRLGLAPCVNKLNLTKIEDIWRFARDHDIFPNLEKATQIGRATSHITVDKQEARWLTQRIREIDETEYDIHWNAPYSSITAHSCGIFKAGAAVTVEKGVALCPEMEPESFISEERSLKDILSSERFQMARNIETVIAEPCRTCEFMKLCLGGCRSKALNASGSVFGPDEFCPLLEDEVKFGEIKGLQASVPLVTAGQLYSKLRQRHKKPACIICIDGDIARRYQQKVDNLLSLHMDGQDSLYRNIGSGRYYLFCDKKASVAESLVLRLKGLLAEMDIDTAFAIEIYPVEDFLSICSQKDTQREDTMRRTDYGI